MTFSEFYSHKWVLLKDHLRGVGELSKEYVLKVVEERDPKIAELAELVGKSHDVAKYTTYFQDYLKYGKAEGELHKHSHLSSIIASWLAARRLKNPLLSAMGFVCVRSHHGNLTGFSALPERIRAINRDKTFLEKQVDSLKKNLGTVSRELAEIGISEAVDFIDDLDASLKDVSARLEEAFRAMTYMDESELWRLYYYTLLVFSALIDADKKDAGRVGRVERTEVLRPDIVTRYIREKFTQEDPRGMHALRRSLFSEVERSLEELLRGDLPSVITITAPTGSGKTLLGLYVALRLMERTKHSRIVYSLPYINIIEQTHSVFEDVLMTYYGKRPDAFTLLKHHHQAFPASGENHERPLDELLLLVDAWDSQLVVTTFEQLLRSIIGSRNSLLKKFHNIADSILILDEVQAIPYEYWRLVRDALLYLAEHLGVKIILMTATMPAIFRESFGSKRSAVELVANRDRYFGQLNRMVIYPHLDREMSAEELVEFFLSKWREGSSALVVLNTVRTSKRVYRMLAERLGDRAVRVGRSSDEEVLGSPKVVLAYLSTSVLPLERKRRIELVKRLLREGRSVILVSTQVVEAGVDLDFDIAFRDLGPLDSIVQTSGRCNRNGRLPEGRVYVVRVAGEKGVEDSVRIYGKVLPPRTLELLRGKGAVKESELAGLIDKYYEDISYRINVRASEGSRRWIDKITGLEFEGLADFSLIEEEPKVPVYVEYDERASEILERASELLEDLREEEDLEKVFGLRAELRRLRAELENYTVEVYKSDESLRSLEPHRRLGILYVPRSEVRAFYDPETGFRDARDGELEPTIL